MELSDEKLENMWHKFTSEIPNEPTLKSISQPIFMTLMEWSYSQGYHHGVEKGMEQIMDVVDKGFQSIGL